MKKIILVQTGLWIEPAEDNKTIAFESEYDALLYCFRYYGNRNFDRRNLQKKKGFRGVFRLRKRWILLTEIKFKPASEPPIPTKKIDFN